MPTLKKTIWAYLYQTYVNDVNLQALFKSYNDYTQAYVDLLNNLQLPIYTKLSGALLDWVAEGLYGIKRPYLVSGMVNLKGPFNTEMLNDIVFNGQQVEGSFQYYLTNDDLFKRIITWNFYKGDGFQFTLNWLKKRIIRFISGSNGTDARTDNTRQVSLTWDSIVKRKLNIVIHPGPIPLIYTQELSEAISQNVVNLPFIFQYNISVSSSPAS